MPFVFYVSNAKETRDHNVLDKVIVFLSAPVQWVTVRGIDGVSSLWHSYVGLVGVQEDNDKLREENAALRQQLASREEQRLENERLRVLVGLRERAPEVAMTFARVIATAPTPLFRSVRVDRGQKDGVKLGAAVVDAQGVIGRVVALTDSYADVMLLVDANNSTDVLVQRTRARARVRGTGSDTHLGVQIEFLSRAADIEPGDVLITSGTGKSFPKGLTVGTVMAVERGAFGLYQQATVEPSVDFNRLEAVMVITGDWQEETSYEDQPEALLELGPMQDSVEAPPLTATPSTGAGP